MILLSIALVSAAILAYEVLLIRVFTIVQWHHFAYMVISIALLGFGASGTFLALARRRLHRHFTAAFTTNATLFGLTALLGYDLGQRVPFNALEIVWDARQLLHLLALYLVFTVPFFCGANCIGLAFIRFGDKIERIYSYNLVGSGVGALGIVAALFVLSPPECLRVIAALGLTSAAIACVEARRARNIATAVGLLVAAMTIAFALPKSWPDLRLSPYKGLSQALERPGAEVIAARSNPLGYLSVVASPTIPFRHAPGLSLNNTVVPPAQLGV